MLHRWHEDYRGTNYVSVWKLCVSGGCGGAVAGMVRRPTLVWAGVESVGWRPVLVTGGSEPRAKGEAKTVHRSHHLVKNEADSIGPEGDYQRTLILDLNFVFFGPPEPRTAGTSTWSVARCLLTSDGGNLQRCRT